MPLILKRGDSSRRRDNDYDVLENGVVVERLFFLDAVGPQGRPGFGRAGIMATSKRPTAMRRHARLRWQRSLRVGGGNGPATQTERSR
jgi:hypothetical protein